MASTPLNTKLTTGSVTYTVPAGKVLIFSAFYISGTSPNYSTSVQNNGVTVGVLSAAGGAPASVLRALTANAGDVISGVSSPSGNDVGISGLLTDPF